MKSKLKTSILLFTIGQVMLLASCAQSSPATSDIDTSKLGVISDAAVEPWFGSEYPLLSAPIGADASLYAIDGAGMTEEEVGQKGYQGCVALTIFENTYFFNWNYMTSRAYPPKLTCHTSELYTCALVQEIGLGVWKEELHILTLPNSRAVTEQVVTLPEVAKYVKPYISKPSIEGEQIVFRIAEQEQRITLPTEFSSKHSVKLETRSFIHFDTSNGFAAEIALFAQGKTEAESAIVGFLRVPMETMGEKYALASAPIFLPYKLSYDFSTAGVTAIQSEGINLKLPASTMQDIVILHEEDQYHFYEKSNYDLTRDRVQPLGRLFTVCSKPIMDTEKQMPTDMLGSSPKNQYFLSLPETMDYLNTTTEKNSYRAAQDKIKGIVGALMQQNTMLPNMNFRGADYSVADHLLRDEQALSLVAGQKIAYLNGKEVVLSAAPFIENQAFYFPLEAVAEIMGCSYECQNNVATVRKDGMSIAYEAGSNTVRINETAYPVTDLRAPFTATQEGNVRSEECVPVLKDGILFVATNYVPNGEINLDAINLIPSYESPESGVMLWGGFVNEPGIPEVRLLQSYETIPFDLRSGLHFEGIVGEVVGYQIEKYVSPDIYVYVTRRPKGEEDPDNMNGKVCAIELIGAQHATLRGLRVGDSEKRWTMLYGNDTLSGSMDCLVDDERISAIIFSTRYFGGQIKK